MKKKLYRCEVTICFDTVVMAESEEEARNVFLEEQGDILEQGLDEMNVPAAQFTPLKKEHKLPENWGQDCIPFGETEDRTIEQIWAIDED